MLKLSHKIFVPREDVVRTALVLLVLAGRGVGVLHLVLSIQLDQQHDLLGNAGNGDGIAGAKICNTRTRQGEGQGSEHKLTHVTSFGLHISFRDHVPSIKLLMVFDIAAA